MLSTPWKPRPVTVVGKANGTNGNARDDLRTLAARLRYQQEHERLDQLREFVAEHGLSAELPLEMRPTLSDVEQTIGYLQDQAGWQSGEALALFEAWREDAILADLERSQANEREG